jgi:AraC family L-rhamnose operon regulatory protein RhaS
MHSSIPIFSDKGHTYMADMCVPLVEAARKGEVRLEALCHGHYPGRRLPKGTLLGLKSVGYWDAKNDQHWALPWHRNEGIEITYLETGTIGFAVDDHTYDLRADDLTITRPWQRHKVGNPTVGASKLHWIILDVGVRRPNQNWRWPSWLLLSEGDKAELTNILRHNEQPVWRATSEIRHSMQLIAKAVETEDRGSGLSRTTVGINALLILLLDLFRRKQVRLDMSLSSSLRTVQLFLSDLRLHKEQLQIEWSVGDMAKSCGLGVTQFVRHVSALTNMTPARYLKHCRLSFAAEALREQSSTTITEIAFSSGFSSSQYFATAFAERFGCSPHEFRVRCEVIAKQGSSEIMMSSGKQ